MVSSTPTLKVCWVSTMNLNRKCKIFSTNPSNIMSWKVLETVVSLLKVAYYSFEG